MVVGGGPAGSTAAYSLASFGFRVLVMERRKFPRVKACGGGLTNKTIRLLHRVFGVKASELAQRDIINYSTRQYSVQYLNDPLLSGDCQNELHFTRRRDYDQFWLRRARRAGADVHHGETVRGIDPDRGLVHRESGKPVRARFVVGADGAHSTIRKQLIDQGKLSFSHGDWEHNLAMALEGYFERSSLEREFHKPVLYLGVLNWGYGWMFPHRNQCLIGLGGLIRRNGDFRELLRAFFDLLQVSPEDSACQIKGHPIPYGNYLKRPAYQSTLLVGDAAGLVDGFSAEGIFYAHRSGELAAWAIKKSAKSENSAARLYTSLLGDHVLPELRASKWIRPMFFGGPRFINESMCRLLLPMVHRPLLETIHGDRVYSGFLPRGTRRHDTIHLQGIPA